MMTFNSTISQLKQKTKEKESRIYLFVLFLFIITIGFSVFIYLVLGSYLDEIYNGIIRNIITLTIFLFLIYYFSKGNWELLKYIKIEKQHYFLISLLFGLFALNNLLMIKYDNGLNYSGMVGLTALSLTIGSINEEVIYRGFIQTFINKYTSNKNLSISKGNIFATILMTLTHLGFFTIMQPLFAFSSIILVTVFSLSVGYLRDKQQSILLPILVHILINYLHLLIQTNI